MKVWHIFGAILVNIVLGATNTSESSVLLGNANHPSCKLVLLLAKPTGITEAKIDHVLTLAKMVSGSLSLPDKAIVHVSNRMSDTQFFDRVHLSPHSESHLESVYIHELGHLVFRLNDFSDSPLDKKRRELVRTKGEVNYADYLYKITADDFALLNEGERSEAQDFMKRYRENDTFLLGMMQLRSWPDGIRLNHLQVCAEECFADLYSAAATGEPDGISDYIKRFSPEYARTRQNSKVIGIAEGKKMEDASSQSVQHDLLEEARTYIWNKYLEKKNKVERGIIMVRLHRALIEWINTSFPKLEGTMLDANEANRDLIRIFEREGA